MIAADLTSALQLQRAGRFADAARCYDTFLRTHPHDADALHLFGVLHHQNGYFDRAIELIGQAINSCPGAPEFHANLAEAYRALGRFSDAIECCRTALRLRPDYPEAANNLGLALHDCGRFADAAEQFKSALEMRPTYALAQNNLGSSLRELGQIGQALKAYRAAVESDPKLALAHSNLGQLLVDEGQAEEGLTHCQESVRLQPGVPAALNNLGNAYRALERWTDAQGAYGEALTLARCNPARSADVPRILANRALALFLEGRRTDAFALFREAVDLAPRDVAMWRYLGAAHDANDDHAAALLAREKMVELAPNDASAHNALGWSLQQEGHLADAGECYRRALELLPYHSDTLLNLGGLSEELGDLAGAETYYRRSRALYPNSSHPLARLAQLLRGKLPAEDKQAMAGYLGRGGDSDARTLPPNSPARSQLLYGLAQVLDAQGEYAGAADCLAQANAMARDQRRLAGRKYNPASYSELVDRMIAGFTPSLFERLRGVGDETRLPVFIFGMPRSGTTLVEQVLASHSKVHGAGELRIARDVFESVPSVMGRSDEMLPCLADLDGTTVSKLSQRHLDALKAILKRSPFNAPPIRIVDKMPDNYLYVGFLQILFPRATFIHVRRDLRDVAVSCWMTSFRHLRWADDPEHLAARCADYRRLTRHWENVLPTPMYELVYERLVDDFQTEAPRLLAACGLDWEPGCGRFHETSRPVRTASVMQVRQPLYRKAVQRWKHYEQPLAELFTRLPAD